MPPPATETTLVTPEVLRGVGYTEAEIAALAKGGVIGVRSE